MIARSKRIDVLAHLVGGFAGGLAVADMDDATWQRMFDANLNCAFHVLRAVIPQMRQAGARTDHRNSAEGCRRAPGPQGRSLQCIKGGAGISDQNGRSGK